MLSGAEDCSRWAQCFADAFKTQTIPLAVEEGAWRRGKAGSWGILLRRECRVELLAEEHPSRRGAGNFSATADPGVNLNEWVCE